MDTINEMNLFRGEDYGKANILPVADAITAEAKAEIAQYLRLGLNETELRITRDFPGGAETVVINKAGAIKLAKQSPLGGVEAAARLQGMLNDAGYPLTLDEELNIAASGEVATIWHGQSGGGGR